MSDVVFTFSSETLADAKRRGMVRPPDQVLKALVAEPGVRGLVIADPFRSRVTTAARRIIGRSPVPASAPLTGTVSVHLQPMRWRRRDSRTVDGAERSYRIYDTWLQEAVRDHGMDRPVLLTFHPLVAAYCPAEWARDVIFYARDDWAEHPAYRRWWSVYRDAYSRIRDRDAFVLAVSPALLDRFGSVRRSQVIPNGISVSEWQVGRTVSEALSRLPGPIALYTGTIDDRIDVDAVARVSSVAGSVAIAGHVADRRVAASLEALNGVYLVGELNRNQIVAATRAADVCIVPHRRTPLTEAMSPLKLYEYLAGGRPVVASNLSPMRDLHHRVHIGVDGEDFGRATAEALRAGPLTEAERQEFLRRNSWGERLRGVLDLIVGAAGSR